jgi:sterol desaturase/sphingolipid hydroxylase (fatty acid hydroxylase superfamily)
MDIVRDGVWVFFNCIPFLSILFVNGILPKTTPFYKKIKLIPILFYFMNTNVLFYGFSQKYITFQSEYRILPIIEYTIGFEALFYIWHRISHIPILYKRLHSHHHVNYIVYPMDFIDVNWIDSFGFHICMNLPLYIIPLYSLEFLTWYFTMITSGFLLHSPVLGRHHIEHHKYFHCNYCFLFPIFDHLFQTNRIES